DPFLDHLVRLLSVYELGPHQGAKIPSFPRTPVSETTKADWRVNAILRSLAHVARRMWRAEEAL
ncbi:hypothetical protein BDQ17DRAFT_1181678, partial [Cyathus striatus]